MRAITASEIHTVAVVNPGVGFLEQKVGAPSAAKTLKIKNTGPGALSITNVSVLGDDAGDYAADTTDMLASVPATTGETTFTVTSPPAASG